MSDNDRAEEKAEPAPALPLRQTDRLHIYAGKRVFHRDRQDYPFDGYKPFFTVDSYLLKHKKYDGSDSIEKRIEVFERGDAVGVLLYNRDTRKIICVEQFRLPTLDRGAGDGWIVETIAGVVRRDKGETPEGIAIKETLDEAGYRIEKPELITTFFSSPGGTSEKIYLYFKEVGNEDIVPGKGGGDPLDPFEDIKIVQYDVAELGRKLRNHEFVDPKLVISALYLQARLGIWFETTERLTAEDAVGTKSYIPAKAASSSQATPRFRIGIKTGDILDVKDVDVWLNPENTLMMMARVIDPGISASVRWGGAEKDSAQRIAVDSIGNELRSKMRDRRALPVRTIMETDPHELRRSNNVLRLLHLAIAQPDGDHGHRSGVRVETREIRPLVFEALHDVHAWNTERRYSVARAFVRMQRHEPVCRSVLIPLIGTGQGRVDAEQSVREILKGIAEFSKDSSVHNCKIEDVFILAFFKRDKEICQRALSENADFIENNGA